MLRLKGKHILVTSGPTKCNLDSIRYIGNRSTGRLGCKIAVKALTSGAEVTMIYGSGSDTPDISHLEDEFNVKLTLIKIETNDDLLNVIENRLNGVSFDVVIHAMAVLDFIPEKVADGKTPSSNLEWSIKLIKSPKVIKLIRKVWADALLVGFKLEVNKAEKALLEKAEQLLTESDADYVVANDLHGIKNGLHKALLVNKYSEIEGHYNTKDEIASGLIDLLTKRLHDNCRC